MKPSSSRKDDPLAAADKSFAAFEGAQYSVRERPTVTVTLPQGWARAMLAGVEAAIFGWVIPTMIFIASFLMVGANVWLKDFTIGESAQMGTAFWASSLGAEIELGGVPITFVPLAWTLLQVVALRLLLLGGREFDSAALWAAVPTFVGTSVLILALASQGAFIIPVLIGSTIVALVGTLWAISVQTERFPKWVRRLGWLWDGIRMGLRWIGVMALVGLIAFVISVVVSWSAISDFRVDLTGGGIPGFSLAVLELSYLPVYAAWALAWMCGAGFTTVGGVFHSALATQPQTTVILPVAEVVPTTAPGSWVIAIPVVCGMALGLWASVQTARFPLSALLRRAGVAVVVFGGVMYAWMWASKGALGDNLLAALGPEPLAWLSLTGMVAGVAFVVAVVAHPDSRAFVKEMSAGVSTRESAEGAGRSTDTESPDRAGHATRAGRPTGAGNTNESDTESTGGGSADVS